MSKKVKDEWKQYLLDEKEDYSVEQIIEKFKYAVSYLKSHHIVICKGEINREQHTSGDKIMKLI